MISMQRSAACPAIAFENTFAQALPALGMPWQGAAVPKPTLVKFNTSLARELGLDVQALDGDAGAAILAGSITPAGAKPIAMAYSGHQFGGFSPRLGDGRALLLGELIDMHGRRRDLHLKGSGRTPFSRGGDGKAVLGSVLREYVMGEAMHALGIPTTRALAAVSTGERVRRETLLPGAVLARVASSHLRVGTFQYAATQAPDAVRALAEYAIQRHDPQWVDAPGRHLGFFCAVRDRQAALLAQWMMIGFVHGVMNTDNMAISGETIDYGPCAFIDAYDPAAVFSSIDTQGRYAFGNQPGIAQWNLTRLAETLLPLIDPDENAAVEAATSALKDFVDVYRLHWLAGMRAKLGLSGEHADDAVLAQALLKLMHTQGVDFTRCFRQLARAAAGQPHELFAMFFNAAPFEAWLAQWQARLAHGQRSGPQAAAAMNLVNPVYIPRNHAVETALAAAVERDDLAPFDRLLDAVTHPYIERADWADLALGAPADAGPHVTFCGT